MILSLLTFITALTISGVAIYYSVAGLAAIFAAAVIPIIIMGGTLEVAKLVTAVWLHRYWRETVWWLKSYLTIAVVVLMFITSMGIFGFLSKAHIDQTTASVESVAQVERMKTEISRQEEIITVSERRIKQIETQGVGGESNIQAQIDQEQQRIDSAYSRIQPAIDEQQRIIDSQTKLLEDQVEKIDERVAQIEELIKNQDVRQIQALVGVRVDGNWGPATARAVTNWKQARTDERQQTLTRLEQVSNNPTVRAAREEISRIRGVVEQQIADSNRLINRLRDRLGQTDTAEVEQQINEQRDRIRSSQTEINTLTSKKYELEGEYRKLEAEVGPIKYLAEFIYGNETNKNLLEEAVRWVILIIIFVFDPLAVLLLIASQYSFESYQRRKKQLNSLNDDEKVVEEEKVKKSIDTESTYSISDTPTKFAVTWKIPVGPFISQEKKTKKSRQKNTVVAKNTTIDKTESTDTETITPSIESEIVTEGVTKENIQFHPSDEYVQYDGKLISMTALKQLHPELILSKDSPKPQNTIIYDKLFPTSTMSGDICIRVDVIPHRVYKFNGNKWINIDKNNTSVYLQSEDYLKYLVELIESKQYDVDLLTVDEQEAVTLYLKK
jgi:hypothetical protein